MSEEEKKEQKKAVQEAETVIWSQGHAASIKDSLARLMAEKAARDAAQKAGDQPQSRE